MTLIISVHSVNASLPDPSFFYKHFSGYRMRPHKNCNCLYPVHRTIQYCCVNLNSQNLVCVLMLIVYLSDLISLDDEWKFIFLRSAFMDHKWTFYLPINFCNDSKRESVVFAICSFYDLTVISFWFNPRLISVENVIQ